MKKSNSRLTMSQHDIRDLLFTAINWLSLTKIEDPRSYAAEFTGKSRRTIDAYLAPSEDRTVPANDLQIVCFEAVCRYMTAHQYPITPFEVSDSYKQPVARIRTLAGAMFIADIEGGYFEATPFVGRGRYNVIAKSGLVLRSQLRRVMRTGTVTVNQACSALGCCAYTLVAYQLEAPFHPPTPPEFGVRYLQAFVAEQIGEAA